MNANKRMLVACMAIGLGVSVAYADEAHDPTTGQISPAAEAVEAPTASETGSMGMMTGGMTGGQGGMGMMGKGMHGGQGGMGMMGKHKQVVSSLDIIDARLAKIEVLLERLSQR